jgi:hypothetical protein
MRREHANFGHGVYAGSQFPRHDRLFDTLVLRPRPQPSHRLLLYSYVVPQASDGVPVKVAHHLVATRTRVRRK